MCGIFIGYIPTYSSDVPLVLNITNGNIPPQYHVGFYENFSTVQYIADDEDPPLLWNDVALDLFTHQFPL